jgi:hypothetical protein
MLSQLYLVSPFEGEEITLDLPLFTWTSVTPFHPNAVYRLQVVEILAGQTPYEAFRSNPLWLEQKGLNSNIMQYPLAARSFTDCSEYAWRVTFELQGGFGEGSFLQQPDFLQESEIWTFKTACEEEEEEESKDEKELNYYFVSGLNAAASPYIQYGEILKFELDNPYQKLNALDVELVDEKGKRQTVSCCIDSTQEGSDEQHSQTSDPIKTGKNYLSLDLSTYGLIPGKYYKLVIKNLKSDHFINFKYVEDED